MPDLNELLRTPGTTALLDRRHAQVLVDRVFADRTERAPGGWLRSLVAPLVRHRRAEADEEDGEPNRDPPATLALPYVPWAASAEEGDGYCIVDGMAIIDVKGVLTAQGYYDWWEERWHGGYQQIGAAIRVARADERVRGILLRVDSPGGLVDGCFELADEIRAGRAAAGGKPIWVHSMLCCSAAYALASGADRILSLRSADVGSIGVVVLHVDMSVMLEEWGLKVEAIQSGARKTAGAPWRPLSDEDRDHFQSIVNEIASWFVALVETGRGLSAEAIRAQEALWFMAGHSDAKRSGLGLGLVDGIATEVEAFAALRDSLSATTATGAPAGTGTNAAMPAARATEDEEKSMTLQERIAALQAKADAGDKSAKRKLAKLTRQAKAEQDDEEHAEGEEDEETAEGTDDDEAAEGDDEDESAEGDDEDESAEDDDDREPAAKATGVKAGFALGRIRAARGREALANKLGAKVAAKKMTFGEAKQLLMAAPKSGPLGDAMRGRDMNPGGDAEVDASAAKKGWSRAVAKVNGRRRHAAHR